MKNRVFINHLDYYIPKGRLTIEDLLNDVSQEGVSVFNGKEKFKEYLDEFLPLKHLAVEKEFSLELILTNLLRRNIEEGKIIPEDIEYVILAFEPNEQLIHFGHKIQEYFGINQNANIVQLSGNYCANVDVAIGFAEKLIRDSNSDKSILIITGNKIQLLENRIVGTYGILGDGVGLILISNKKENAEVEIVGQKTLLKGGLHEIDFAKDNTIVHFQSYMESFSGALYDNNIESSDLSQIFLHNANILLPKEAIKMCDVDETCFYEKNKLAFGHFDTVDLIMNLKDYLVEKKESNSYLASLSNGVTGTYVTTIYRTLKI